MNCPHCGVEILEHLATRCLAKWVALWGSEKSRMGSRSSYKWDKGRQPIGEFSPLSVTGRTQFRYNIGKAHQGA